MMSVHGTSPNEALYGRAPRRLADFNEPETALDDIQGGSLSRHIHRLRAMSLSRIIRGHAAERLRIAEAGGASFEAESWRLRGFL